MPYLKADDGVELYYVDEGRGSPMLLVHGVTFNNRAFVRNVPELARSHRVVALDLRGHGYSGKPDSGLTLKQSARDVETAIDRLGLGSVTLVGWSSGAQVVLDYLDQFGDGKVSKAVLVDQSPYPVSEPGWEHGQVAFREWLGAQQQIMEDRLGFQQWFVSTCFAGGKVPDGTTADTWLRESMLTPNVAVLAYLASLASNDYRDVLGRLRVPVLLCYGAKSASFPTKVGEYMREQIPNSELVMFERSGHSPFWEEPERFNAAVARFVG